MGPKRKQPLMNRPISVTSAASPSGNAVRVAAVSIRPARRTFRQCEPAAGQKTVAAQRGGPQNSNNGAAVEEGK
jgi:hypothetical protein